MASSFTHAELIKDLYQELDVDYKLFLKDDLDRMKTFAQSMDVLFFYNFYNPFSKEGKKLDDFAHFFHTHKTNEFFINLINYIKYNYYGKKPEVMAFLYGMISHFVLDSNIHPYVIYKTGKFNKNKKETFKYNGLHHDLEVTLDKYLIRTKLNTNPIKYKIHEDIFNVYHLSDELKEVIDAVFKETFNIPNFSKYYLKGIQDIRLAFKHFRYDPYGFKYHIYKLVNHITPKTTLDLRVISYYYDSNNEKEYLNSKKKKWNYPTDKKKTSRKSALEIYDKSLKDTKKIIDKVNDYIYENKKIKLENLFKDLSYETGINYKNRKELKHFEF